MPIFQLMYLFPEITVCHLIHLYWLVGVLLKRWFFHVLEWNSESVYPPLWFCWWWDGRWLWHGLGLMSWKMDKAYSNLYTYTYIHIHRHTYTYTHTYTHSHIHLHVHTFTYTLTHTHIHTHTYTYTYRCTDTDADTDIHTHTQIIYTCIYMCTRLCQICSVFVFVAKCLWFFFGQLVTTHVFTAAAPPENCRSVCARWPWKRWRLNL